MPAAGVLEEGDVIRGQPPRDLAARKVVVVAEYIALLDRAARDRRQDIADAVEGGLAAVDEDARTPGRLVVGLPRIGREAADQVEMGAGPQVRALHQRLAGAGAGGDDV